MVILIAVVSGASSQVAACHEHFVGLIFVLYWLIGFDLGQKITFLVPIMIKYCS
jgi:hypothetical protein